MKRFLCLISALCLLFALCACDSALEPTEESSVSSSSTDEPTTESTTEPTSDATTESSSSAAPADYALGMCNAVSYRDENGTIWAMCIAEIVNTGDTALFLDYGSFELRDGNDAVVMMTDSVSAYPQVILPGESGYYFEVVEPDLPETEELTLTVTPDIREAAVDCLRYDVTDTQLRNSPYGGLELLGKAENNTGTDGELVCVAAILLDKEGAPLGLLTTFLTDALPAGAQTDFSVASFMLPAELTAAQVANTLIFAYPLQEQR